MATVMIYKLQSPDLLH